MDETRMQQLIEEWNKKHPDNKAALPELLMENEKQELIWCEEAQEWFPKYTMEETETGEIVYLLNVEENYTYNPALDENEPEEPIGYYGRKWREFMEENYPDAALMMSINSLDWETLPRKVDKEANELYDQLDKQFRKANPRPTTFMEIATWEKMKQLEIDHTVMETVVLQYREA